MDALSTLQALLTAGVPANRLAYVTPARPAALDAAVFQRAVDALKAAGVAAHTEYALAGWQTDAKGNLSAVECLSPATGEGLVVDCVAALMMDEKSVDGSVLKAVHDACLVFDGRLVINADCCTNDARIFAAGPVTKYSRKYYADARPMTVYSSSELGGVLASAVLARLDPLARGRKQVARSSAAATAASLATLAQPPPALAAYKTWLARLPGGLQRYYSTNPAGEGPGADLTTRLLCSFLFLFIY